MPLLCHGESTDGSVDVFDREAEWVDKAGTLPGRTCTVSQYILR